MVQDLGGMKRVGLGALCPERQLSSRTGALQLDPIPGLQAQGSAPVLCGHHPPWVSGGRGLQAGSTHVTETKQWQGHSLTLLVMGSPSSPVPETLRRKGSQGQHPRAAREGTGRGGGGQGSRELGGQI